MTDLDGMVCPSLDLVPCINESLDSRSIDMRSGNKKWVDSQEKRGLEDLHSGEI
jgi:hypothetical protein